MARTAQRACAQPDASCRPSRFFTGCWDWPIAAIQALASPSLGVELTPIDVQDPGEIERAITAFGRQPNGGLIVAGSSAVVKHRKLIIDLALQYRLPNVYGFRYFRKMGASPHMGLMPLTNISALPLMSIAFSKERRPLTCQCKLLPGTSWLLISRLPRRLVLLFR
jgi:hypothetical protein